MMLASLMLLKPTDELVAVIDRVTDGQKDRPEGSEEAAT